ncbi:tripartite tricarboxylate transporter TctB family protein [Chelativorans salis]|uniref:Tripartite tricarboxylate transporter TctB family protein n=1 Tax=Chelativorans salis TaxID=2978478 RepID=A0ABT2LUE3_9HYPH|nr:tripartite tricarboxylate transporter TctB family protein [Chelativorans sp. EGI FJ00035]MCT7378150.1 tripartite tricarboxylate transporter TctB family protein [Chelativorans sp. EGI FJ00035]
MTDRRAILTSLVLIAVSAVYFATALQYSAGSRAIPISVATLTILFLFLDILSQGEGRVARGLRRAFGGAASIRPGGDAQEQPVRQEALALAWIVAFTALATAFGFYIAIPVYVISYLWLHAGKPIWIAALVAISLTGALYLIFEVLLGYAIFEGLIFGGYM